jgi:hypothetical protein
MDAEHELLNVNKNLFILNSGNHNINTREFLSALTKSHCISKGSVLYGH